MTRTQNISHQYYAKAHQHQIKIIEMTNYDDDHELYQHIQHLNSDCLVTRIVAPHESDVLRAAHLRGQFGLPGMTVAQASAFTDKYLMKQIVSSKGLRVPAYAIIETLKTLTAFVDVNSLPIIIKPQSGTGCNGIHIIENQQQLADFCRNNNNFDQPLLAEAYIQGKLYNINGIVQDHKITAVWPSMYWQAPDQLMKGHSASSFLMADTNPLTSVLNNYAGKIIDALPAPSAFTFHLEAFVQNHQHELILCEIAARVGGKGVNQSWKTAFDINLKNIDFCLQAGLSCSPGKLPERPTILCAEVWFPLKQGIVTHKADICPFDWVHHYYNPTTMGQYYAEPTTIEHIFGGSSLITGDDESQIMTRVDQFEEWFYENNIIDDNQNK